MDVIIDSIRVQHKKEVNHLRNLTDSDSFVKSLETICTKLINKSDKSLRRAVRDSSNFHWEDRTFFRVSRKSLTELLQLSILSWYMPEEISYLLRLDILEVKNLLSNEDQVIIDLLLKSKCEMIQYLLNTNLWSVRSFFGNIINEEILILVNLKVQLREYQRKRPCFPQRKRGYSDKGSRALDHTGNPNKYIILSKEFKEEEEKQRSKTDTLLFLSGFLV